MYINKAFTLVEILVVITLVGILLGASVPAYNKYITKAQVIEMLSVADSYKLSFIENQQKQNIKLNNDLIEDINLDMVNSRYVIQINSKVKDGMELQLHGEEKGNVLVWSCHVGAGYNEYVPSKCQNNEMIQIT